MLRILIILVIISFAYWLGFYAKKRIDDYRPVCFIYTDHTSENKMSNIDVYWGYWEQPNSNDEDVIFKVALASNPKNKCYFVINMNKIPNIHDTEKTTIVINAGYHQRHNEIPYITYLYSSGYNVRYLRAEK